MEKYAIYCRVSTAKQGASGLGMDAQKQMCINYIQSRNGVVDAEFADVESGKSRNRQGLWDAIGWCIKNNATLVIAKLDRLARDVEFTFKVINSGVQIHFCDMPMVNTMILGVFASVAQYERELISQRTKLALEAKKAKGEIWVRNTDTTKAVQSSVANRREQAKNNKANMFLKAYIADWETDNGRFSSSTPKERVKELCEKLNRLGATTSTGLEFNPQRLRAMVDKIKNLYN